MWRNMKRNLEWLVIVALLVGAVMAVGCMGDANHGATLTVSKGSVQIGEPVDLTGTIPTSDTYAAQFVVQWSVEETIEVEINPAQQSLYYYNLSNQPTDILSDPFDGSKPNWSHRSRFIPPKAGKFKVTFLVTYPTTNTVIALLSETITVTPPSGNATPVAAISGVPPNIVVGNTVTLKGTSSYDVDGDPLTYRWLLVMRAAGSNATLTGDSTAISSFVPDVAGEYMVVLVVSDGVQSSPGAYATMTASPPPPGTNTAPEANAGPDQNAPAVGDTVALNGNMSSDADGNTLAYSWSFVSRPVGSSATLTGANTVSPSFTYDKDGEFIISLIVNDGTVSSAEARVRVSPPLPPPPDGPISTVTDLQNTLASNAFLVFFSNDFLETLEFGPVGGNMTFTYMMPSWYPSHYGNTSIQRTGTWAVADAGGFAQATENAGPRTLNTAVPVNSTNTLLMTGYMSYNNTSSVDIETWIKAATLSNATLSGHKLSAYVDVYTLSYQFNADGTGVHVEDVYSHPFTWAIDTSTRKVVVTFTSTFTDRNGVVNSKHNLFMTERHKADVGKRELGVVKFGNGNTIIGGIMLLWDWL